MKKYPRIYSVSTVGLIFHYHSDYLLHPFRTDFNGESGIGKSMIADLLQLIFIAKRKYYKPGTDSTGGTGREIDTLPLDSIGYAFINIQKNAEQYLTIGVHIQKNTGAVVPFIIQKGIQWEKSSSFEYLDRILLHTDFLTGQNQIPDIDILKKKILKPKGFILEAFHNDVSRYHQLLFANEILPMDLSQDDDKLNTYSQIIQSFARAKTTTFKKNEFKNFLFADDQDIFEEYKKQIDSLETYHRQYNEQKGTIKKITDRFDALTSYQIAIQEKTTCLLSFHTIQTAYDYYQYFTTQREHAAAKKSLTANTLKAYSLNLVLANHELAIAEEEYRDNTVAREQKTKEKHRNLEQIPLQSEVHIVAKNQVNEVQSKLNEYVPIKNGIAGFDSLLSRYSSPDQIKRAIESTPEQKLNKTKLRNFLNNLIIEKIDDEFWNSDYPIDDFNVSAEKRFRKRLSCSDEIKQCQDLINAYSSDNANSLMQWTIEQRNISFTIEEESVLVHFLGLLTSKPITGSEHDRYIHDPSFLLKNLKLLDSNEDEIWIDLGGVAERIRLVKEPIFRENAEIQKHAELVISKLTELLASKTDELERLEKLAKALLNAGWSSEIHGLLKSREFVLSFKEDDSLPTLSQYETLKQWYERRQEYSVSINTLQEQLDAAKKVEIDVQEKLNTLKTTDLLLGRSIDDYSAKISSADQMHQRKTLEIETLKEKIEGVKINQHHEVSDQLLTEINRSAKTILDSYLREDRLDTMLYYKREISPLESQIAVSNGKIKDWEDPFHVLSVPYLENNYLQSKAAYSLETKKEFDEHLQYPAYDIAAVDQAHRTLQRAEEHVTQILETRIRKILPDNDLLKSSIDFEAIARELLPNVFDGREIKDFEGNLQSVVTGHLNSINDGMKQIDEHKIRLISSIFNKVSDVYYEFDDKIKDIKKFFDEKEITGGMKVKIDFHPSTHYPIDWINSLKKQISTKSLLSTPLFKNQIDDAVGAEEIIINTFLQYSDSRVKDPDIRKLTNPKSYFDVEVSLVRPSGEKSDGSSGQDYAKIALLCIARLSRIERNKNKKAKGHIPGIRFMPIDEVAGLGGNFNLLYQIAEEYDYQILTMTISPDLVLEDGKQYVYILNSNKKSNEEKINLPPFGMFSNMTLEKDVAAFIKAQVNAKGTHVAGN
jgi:DNA repair protein SbcC/Rad50